MRFEDPGSSPTDPDPALSWGPAGRADAGCMGVEVLSENFNRALITGGAGFLGINLTRHLMARGHEVASIDIEPFDYPEQDRVRVIDGDIRNVADLDRAMEGVEVVVHCAAALPRYKKEEIYSTDVEGTRNVCEAAVRHGARRLIHISTTAVYGVPDHHPLVEDDPIHGVGPYGEAKVEAESICAGFRDKGLVVSIIRPKSFIGPERLGVFGLLYDWAHDGRNFPMIGSGRNRYQLLDVEDLCDAIHLCATLPRENADDVFNIGAREFTTMKEDYQVVLDHAGHGKRIVGMPAKPLIWTLRVLELFNLSPLYKWVYETACEDSFLSIERAEKKLGWDPKFSNKQALLRNFEWYLDNMDNFANASGVTHRVPWKQGALGIAKLFF